jgi:NAD(P)-dependent dehydrogenase (short-subunit alcohol dehydrogenase family)
MDTVRSELPESELHLEVADLSSLQAVSSLGASLLAAGEPVHALVNNAGVYRARMEYSADGYEMTMAVNHLAHFHLTRLLMPLLKDSEGRVVNVSSAAHRRGSLAASSLEEAFRRPRRYDGWKVYSDSKLANILFTEAFSRRFSASEVPACSLHPGVLATRIWNQNRNPVSLLMVLFKPLMGKAAVGGEAVLKACTAPPAAIHGRYFDKDREAVPKLAPDSAETAEALWELSERLVDEAL